MQKAKYISCPLVRHFETYYICLKHIAFQMHQISSSISKFLVLWLLSKQPFLVFILFLHGKGKKEEQKAINIF